MNLIQHPEQFKTGVRVVMLVLRGKDGGKTKPDHHARKVVTTSVEEWNKAVEELAAISQQPERIYSSINARDMEKAIYEFKRRQLDADWYDSATKQ